jgi:hypothetical protein
MALFLLQNRELNLYFMVHSNVWKYEKIWLSGTLIIIRKPKVWWTDGRTWSVKYTVIKLNLYFMVHSNVWKFEKIWLSGTLIIIQKPKVWRTDMRIPIYSRLSSSGGIKMENIPFNSLSKGHNLKNRKH